VRAVIEDLRHGYTPDQIYSRQGRRRAIYLTAIEEEAANCGELNQFPPTAESVVKLRDRRRLRWERIAARVFGDAGRVADAKRLYDSAMGSGAAARSYTGRGRRFPKMTD
jgi:hypothetical protein